MTDTNAAPASGAGDTGMSAREASALLSVPAERPKDQEQPAAEAPEPATAAEENSAATPEAGADEQPTGDEAEASEAETPIDAPKFWNAAEKEAFAALPRAVQESILTREKARNAEIDRRMQEIAQTRKASDAERNAALQARQQYEQALPQLYQQFQQQVAGEFVDIKTWQDVETMQQQDPLRFQRWQVRTQQAQQLSQAAAEAQQRQQQEQVGRFENYKATEAKRFLELAPDFADTKTAPARQAEVQAMFSDIGVSKDELRALVNGQPISIHDHRFQLMAAKAAKYDAAQKALKNAKPQTQAPAQRPGVATGKGEARTAEVRGLHEQLRRTGSAKIAAQILSQRRG